MQMVQYCTCGAVRLGGAGKQTARSGRQQSSGHLQQVRPQLPSQPDPQPRREAADAAAHHGSWAAARARKEAEAATKFSGTKTTFD